MKKFYTVFLLFGLLYMSFSKQLFATDVLNDDMNARQELMLTLDSIKRSFFDTTFFDLKKLAIVQHKIIGLDNELIDGLSTYAILYEETSSELTSLKEKHQMLKDEASEMKQWIEWGIYGAGGLLLLFFIFFILFFVQLSKSKKHKKNALNLEELIGGYKNQMENLNNESESLQENKAAYENNLNEAKKAHSKVIDKLNTDIAGLQNKNATLSNELEAANNNNNNEELQHTVNNLKQQLIAKDHDIENLNKKLQESEQMLHNKSEDNSEDVSSLNEELHNITRQWEAEKDVVKELREELQKIQDFIDKNEAAAPTETTSQDNSALLEELESLKSKLTETESLLSQKETELAEKAKKNVAQLPEDAQELAQENEELKNEINAYKTLLNEELEVRKDIMKFINEIKDLR